MSSSLDRLAGLPELGSPLRRKPEPAVPLSSLDRLASTAMPSPTVVPAAKKAPILPVKVPLDNSKTWRGFSGSPDLPLEPQYPIENLAAMLTMGPAGRLLGPATAGLPWLARTAIQGGAGMVGQGAVLDVSSGRNPLPNVPLNLAIGTVANPVIEGVTGAIGRGLAEGAIRRGARALKGIAIPGEQLESSVLGKVSTPVTALEKAARLPVLSQTALAPVPTPQTMTRVGPTTGPTVPQVFKPEKIGLPEVSPEIEHVKRTLTALGMDVRRVRTFEDMKAAAQDLGMSPVDLLKGAAQRPISDAEVVATANLINEQADLHIKAVAALGNPALTEPESIVLHNQANRSQFLIEQALKRRVRGGTESGRSVAAFRIIGNKTLDPAYWYTTAHRLLADKPFTPEIKAAIDRAIAGQDRLSLAQIMGQLQKSGGVDKLTTLAKAFMLSNPGTDVRNVGGNLGVAILHGVADLPATALDKLMAVATGIRTKSTSLRQFGQLIPGVVSGVRKAGEVLRYGDTAENVLARYDFNSNVHFDAPALEFFTQAVFRRLGAEDYLFREPQKFKAIAELAEVMAKNAGLRGDAFLERVKGLIQTPTPEMIQLGEATAAYRTFNNPSAFASWLGGLERAGTSGKILGTAVIPFKRTPVNIAKTIIDFSPFGAPKALFHYLGTHGVTPFMRQRYFVEGLGRSITGTSLAALGWALGKAGLAVGGPATSASGKALRRVQGIPDYAVKMGGDWVGIGNNAPAVNILMEGVDAANAFAQDKSLVEKGATSTFAMVKGLSEQTFLKGVKGASEAASDPGRFGSTWLEGVTGMVVPALLGAVARGTDPYERRINSPLEAVQARIPGARTLLEPQVTALGELRKQNTGVLGQVFSPVRISPEQTGSVNRAIQSSGYAPSVSTNKMLEYHKRQAQLTEHELTQLNIEVGNAQKVAMERVSRGSLFFGLDRDREAYILRRAADQAEQLVRDRWKRSIPLPRWKPVAKSVGPTQVGGR